MAFTHSEIEKKAQAKWKELDLYRADLADASKEKYYLLVEFPYPSGDLHIGHWYAFSVTDIHARLMRAKGYNVLFPIGFDAFGLPAENAAIKHGVDPKEWTLANIERMRVQLASMGASFDWSKEVIACDPSYYQWTQWLFTKLFEHGLAERKAASVKWCPQDQTVLANEQIEDGTCFRCGSVVEERVLTQWFLKITQYADRLLSGLSELPWREEIKDAQRAWIGKSDGAKIRFSLQKTENSEQFGQSIEVFTTRPDTIYGATYVVLAPEHSLLPELQKKISNTKTVEAYLAATKQKTERERSENKDKTGVKLEGVTAENPATKEEIPVYVADYVLGSYGTGAVMAVPAHDERDFEFAKKHGLSIRPVISYHVVNPHNPPREGKVDTKRNVIHAIVRNPKDQSVLVGFLKDDSWGDRKPVNFVIGGVEEGEDWVEAAQREILEETGYGDVSLVREIPLEVDAHFYQMQKDVNRDSHVRTFLFDLASDTREPVAEEEHQKHEYRWIPEGEVADRLNIPTDQLVWKYIQNGGFAHTGSGRLINSGEFNGKSSEAAAWEIVASLGAAAERATQYRIRDWSVSRQRYWGCPIPIVYDPSGAPHAIPAEHLPWLLPEDVNFASPRSADLGTSSLDARSPSHEVRSPLASSQELKDRVTGIFGEGWTPEYDTLDTFVDSSWYFMRYLDPANTDKFSDTAMMEKWLPVDRYSGGSEHTTLHLLYARFFTKALFDLGLSPVDEPFSERYNRGLIMGPDGQKMSKSKGNVVNPDEFVQTYGSDAVRVYLAFIGPYNEPRSYPWSLEGVASMRKFLDRVVRLTEKTDKTTPQEDVGLTKSHIEKALARAAKKVEEETGRFKTNTAVAALMTLLNELEAVEKVPPSALRTFLVLLAPFAPHLSEHLWEQLGGEGSPSDDLRTSIHQQPWPIFDPALLEEERVLITVQVNGKRRGSVSLTPEATEEEALARARELPAVATALAGKEPVRVVYVPGKIINLVG